MASARGLQPTIVRAFSRSGDDLGLGRLPWPNVAADDVLELDGGGVVRVVDVVKMPPDSVLGALVKVALGHRDTLAR